LLYLHILSITQCSISSRQITASQPQNQRNHNRNIHRSWSLLDVKELRKRKIGGQPDLAAFLRQASALVHSLSQATCLLEKGCQLNIATSTPHTEQNDTLNTVHNELWVAADSAPCGSKSPCLTAERSYGVPRSLPSRMPSKENDKSTGRITTKCNSSKLSRSKDCNIDTQMEIDQIHQKGKSKCFCDRHRTYNTFNLPCRSNLGIGHCHCSCSTYTFPIHRSALHLSDCDDDQMCGRSPFFPPHCSPRAYRQYLVDIRRQIISASLPIIPTNSK